jgi:hypothetical protein
LTSAVSQAPVRPFDPALLLGHVAAPIETRHPVPAAFLESRNEHPLELGVARAHAREEVGRGNPLGEKLVAGTLDAEPRAARGLVPGQRQDQPPAILEPVDQRSTGRGPRGWLRPRLVMRISPAIRLDVVIAFIDRRLGG